MRFKYIFKKYNNSVSLSLFAGIKAESQYKMQEIQVFAYLRFTPFTRKIKNK